MTRRGARKPPPGLWERMNAAGARGDAQALGVLRAQYRAWETDVEAGLIDPTAPWTPADTGQATP